MIKTIANFFELSEKDTKKVLLIAPFGALAMYAFLFVVGLF